MSSHVNSALDLQFLGFLTQHLWDYDRFNCLKWNSGRQPGAFRRVMTVSFPSAVMDIRYSDETEPCIFQYSYLASVPLLVVFSTSMTAIKVREGTLRNPTAFSAHIYSQSSLQAGSYFPTRQVHATNQICQRGSLMYPTVMPMPVQLYSENSRALLLPLYFVFATSWALEL